MNMHTMVVTLRILRKDTNVRIIWEVKQTRKKPTKISAEKYIVLLCLRTRCFEILKMSQITVQQQIRDNKKSSKSGITEYL
jgi:hypothetical protein